MTTTVVVPAPIAATVTIPGPPTPAQLVDAWFSGRKATTVAAYRNDLAAFARWAGVPDEPAAIAWLIERGHAAANRAAHEWRGAMLDGGLSPATVNRRLSALRSVVSLARRLGLVVWAIDVEGVKAKAYRDTTGPGIPVVAAMLGHLDRVDTPKTARDRALVRLMFDRGLRRGEVVALDYADIDLEGGRVQLLGKGQSESEWVTVGPKACQAIGLWIQHRGDRPGPLFTNLDRARKGDGRLTGRSVAAIVNRIGSDIGAPTVRPHGLRHTAITAALDATGGDVRSVARFSRHADIRTLQRYDDNRTDLGGDIAQQIAQLV